ncbi:hypothetical protein ABEY43_06155 [Priestia megaterium]
MDKWEALKEKLKHEMEEVAEHRLFQKKYAYREVLEMMTELEQNK